MADGMQLKNIKGEYLLYVIFVVAGMSIFSSFDVYENFHSFSRLYEWLELDEIVLAIPLILLCAIVYAGRRRRELRQSKRAMQDAHVRLQRAYDRIRDLTQSREEFMAVACHELKSPLAGATSALRLAEMADSMHEVHELVALALDGLDNLQLLINDVLYFSNLQHTSELQDQSEFSVRNTLESVVRIGKLAADEKGLDFTVNVADSVPETVLGYEGWVRLISLNLLSNAVKFTAHGGVYMQCHLRHSSRVELEISIHDTGPGIPEEQFGIIFEPYEQGGRKGREKKDGMGLGLSVVRRLVRRLDGFITVESTVGKGSVFTVRLPVALP